MITIRLNGEPYTTGAITVATLLRELDSPPRGVAVAVNGHVVPRATHEATPLHEGDSVEVIRAVQGG
jgi:thiamine biosynthesis protein ThiS